MKQTLVISANAVKTLCTLCKCSVGMELPRIVVLHTAITESRRRLKQSMSHKAIKIDS